MTPESTTRYDRLRDVLRGYGSVLVAYSGGVDSALVLQVASETLGNRALGVLGVSPSVAPEDIAIARATAKTINARLRELPTAEFENEAYARNPVNRCYFCKSELYTKLTNLAAVEGFAVVADGFHLDDLGDIRPGQQAGRERNIRSPLAEAGFRKTDVRELAKALGVPVWDRPAAPCLSSRVQFGIRVTPEVTAAVAQAERLVRAAVPATRDLRVRHLQGHAARIEVDAGCVAGAEAALPGLTGPFRELGYTSVTVSAYRTGGANVRPLAAVS